MQYQRYQAYPDKEYKRILRTVGITKEPKGKILEAGCASSIFGEHLARMGFKVIGVDIDDRYRNSDSSVEFFKYDIRNLPFPDESFDLVFCAAVLHHIPKNIMQCAEQFYRLLKPEGKVYFFEPYANCLNSFLWYKIYLRYEQEEALDPLILKSYFEKAGFKGFEWEIIRRIKHRRCGPFGYLREVMGWFLPNTCMVGNIKK